MSNARARAHQLHKQMLAPKRVTNRQVVPDGALTVARHPDAGHAYGHCVECGYAVCNCADGPEPPPFGERGFTYARPAPQPAPGAFVCPKGWAQDPEYTRNVRLCMGGEKWGPSVAKCIDGGWNWFLPGSYGYCANPYAAMLCALGCEVSPASIGGWRVVLPDSLHGQWWGEWWGDSQLRHLVERLTAERANEQAVIAECREIRREEDRDSDARALARARQQGEQIGRELAAQPGLIDDVSRDAIEAHKRHS